MGKDGNHGVVDSFGRVYKGDGATLTDYYSDAEGIANFYVVDGGIVPTSLGINSSLTISAMALRIAEKIVGSANLPVEVVVNDTETIYFPK